jgi:hypothetical protein
MNVHLLKMHLKCEGLLNTPRVTLNAEGGIKIYRRNEDYIKNSAKSATVHIVLFAVPLY